MAKEISREQALTSGAKYNSSMKASRVVASPLPLLGTFFGQLGLAKQRKRYLITFLATILSFVVFLYAAIVSGSTTNHDMFDECEMKWNEKNHTIEVNGKVLGLSDKDDPDEWTMTHDFALYRFIEDDNDKYDYKKIAEALLATDSYGEEVITIKENGEVGDELFSDIYAPVKDFYDSKQNYKQVYCERRSDGKFYFSADWYRYDAEGNKFPESFEVEIPTEYIRVTIETANYNPDNDSKIFALENETTYENTYYVTFHGNEDGTFTTTDYFMYNDQHALLRTVLTIGLIIFIASIIAMYVLLVMQSAEVSAYTKYVNKCAKTLAKEEAKAFTAKMNDAAKSGNMELVAQILDEYNFE